MKKLIIAEKPSVCGNIAHAVGATEHLTSDGGNISALINDEYIVTHALGHLYSIGEPTDYGYNKNFTVSYNSGELPMFPDKFDIIPSDQEEYKTELRDFLDKLIKLDDVDEIIEATDAAREGELIFREIYYKSGSKKPVKRLWISSVTDQAILKGLSEMKPMSEYDNIYKSAKLRQELDWILGMNMSRLYTALDGGIERVGRIMTPLLGIIVERDEKIDGFTSTTSYKTVINGIESVNTFETKTEAENVVEKSIGANVIVSLSETEKQENRPLLFSLSTLQMEANSVYGLTIQQTLDIAQSLYEKKYTTYPRTDSEYLSEDMREEIIQTVDMLSRVEEFSRQAEIVKLQGLNIDERVINDKKITDHHAIIPNNINVNLSSLSENERKVYTLIVQRLLKALDKPFTYKEFAFRLNCEGIEYAAKFKKPIDLGFRRFEPDEKNKDLNTQIPNLSDGDIFPCEDIIIRDVVSKPPKHFTDKSLLSVMSNIDNRIDDKDLQSAVKGKGLGTSATRAGIIEKLINSGYCMRKEKLILSTGFGRSFVHSLPQKLLSVERTAEWEQMLEEIVVGEDKSQLLTEQTKDLVRQIIDYEKTNSDRKPVDNPNKKSFEHVVVGKCPRCGKDVIEKTAFYGCSSYKNKDDKGCGFSFSKAHSKGWYEGEITPSQATSLLENKRIKLKYKDDNGNVKIAEWYLSDEGKYINIKKAPYEANVIGICPWCSKKIVETPKAFSCESGKDGCGWTLWKENKYYKLNITAKTAEKLLKYGEAEVSFKGVSGKYTKKFKLTETEKDNRKYINLAEVK